jgi:tetratricopeptide (TPR) repeat protein
LRIAARLANAANGEAIWAQHYDRPAEDIFEVQDDVAHLVAAAVANLLEIEITTRSSGKPPANLSSYEHLLQGHWHFRKLTLSSNLAARQSYERACQLDPRNADALSWLGATYSNDWLQLFSSEGAQRGARLCDEAVSLDPANAHAHAMVGFAQLCVGNLNAAVQASEQAMSLNPGDTNVLANRSYVVTYEGRTGEARQLLDRARRLNPLPPIWYAEFESLIEFAEGNFPKALAGIEAIPEAAWDVMYMLACYGHLGMRDKARAAVAGLRQLGVDADFLLGASREPFRDSAIRDNLMAGLNKALSP